MALWGHRVLSEVDLDGPAVDVAADLVQRCIEFDEPTQSGLTPLWALLAEVRSQGLAGGRLKAQVDSIAVRLARDRPAIDWPYDLVIHQHDRRGRNRRLSIVVFRKFRLE